MREITNKEETRSQFHKFVFPKIIWGKPLSNKDREIFVNWKKAFNPPMHIFNFYKDKRILFEIVKELGNSELCLNESVRWLYASKIDYLLKIIYFYRVLEYKGESKKGQKLNGLTFYKGLMNFKKRQPPPFSPKEKRDWQDNVWSSKNNPQYEEKCIGYNFGLDIDGKNIEDSYRDAKKVFKFFKKFNIKFSVWCSGSKGWHFIIPYEEFKALVEPFELNYCVTFCQGLMLDLVEHLKVKKVDTTIYSSTRYLKEPYTIDARNGRVILPLTDKEFLYFIENKENYFSQEYCMSLKNLGNRGVYLERKSNPKGFYNLVSFLEENIK